MDEKLRIGMEMKRLGDALQVFGVVLIFAGLLWIKYPAVMPIEYSYGLVVILVGGAIFFIGIRLSKRASNIPSKGKV